jgi:tetratricopeptide (TPR) repeat protein
MEVPARSDHLLDSLERMHLSQLEQTGQVEAALEVLMEDLTEPSAHSRVIAFLERHQRFAEALEHAQFAHADLPDDWRLEADLLRCVEREGLNEQALVMRQSQFDRSPSVERYQALLQAGARADLAVDALRLSLLKQIEAQEIDDFKRGRRAAHATTWRSGSTAARGPDVSLRAAILCAELRWLEALALVQSVVRGLASCDPRHLERIAVNLPKEHASEAVTLLQRVFDGVMQHSSSPYQEALSLVKRIGQRMDVTHRDAWLLELRTKYKAKRNFIRDMPVRW